MNLIEELTALGANPEEAIKRFMNNTALFEKMIKKLPSAIEDTPVMKYIESGEYETATANAHTLKGVTGNLSVTPLYNAYTDIVASLRNNEPDKAKEILTDILPVQEKIIGCIRNAG